MRAVLKKLIAILRGVRTDEVSAIAEALIESGITWIEVPLNSPQPFDSIELLSRRFGAFATVGAGTVLSLQELRLVAAAGGKLMVAPDCKPEVIRAARQAGMLAYPGVLTPSEAFAALDSGANGLKIFPAGVMGPAGLKALRAVLPEATEVLAVGGAEPGNFAEWIKAGADGFGLGSALYKPGMSAAEVGARARDAVQALSKT
jgi:2-dehydro-3-deoxyphosphogalactonate aldolase